MMLSALLSWVSTAEPASEPMNDASGETAPDEVRVVVKSDPDGLNRQRDVDERSPGFTRALTIDPATDPTHGDDLASVLERAPGLRVRSLGGLGQFSGVQIRGSSPQQVQFFLEGIPVNDSYGGFADLAGMPLDGLDRVEIHRGYVPIAYGGASIGGAIDLVGKRHTGPLRWSVFGGYGSFGTREAGASVAVPFANDRWSVAATATYGGSEGDFAYFDDGGTPRLRDDDETARRLNNDYDRVFGMTRVDGQHGRTTISQQVRFGWREHGVPGMAGTQATESRQGLASLRSITRVDVADVGPRAASMAWLFGLSLGRRHYRDPLGQVGIGVDDQVSRNLDGYLSPRVRVSLWPGAQLAVMSELRNEVVHVDERDPPEDHEVLASGDATRTRLGVAAGLELEQRLFDDVWRLVPAVRVDGLVSRFAVPEGEGEVNDEGEDRFDGSVSPRFGTRIRFAPGAELRGSVGRYFRAPSMFEMFGDRGFVVGNEALRPETGLHADGGFVYDVTVGKYAFYGQVSGFVSRSRDLIQFVRSGPALRPINLEGALQRGVDAMLELRLWDRTVELSGEYTFLDSRNRTPEAEQQGRPLPGRPRHEGSGRVSVGHAFGRGWAKLEPRVAYLVDGVSETALDPSGRHRLPSRVLHALVFNLHWIDGVHLGFEVRNLADLRTAEIVPSAGPPDPIRVPISDFIGYPLPGRSFFVRITIDAGVMRRSKRARRPATTRKHTSKRNP